ncbi:MAG TPA: hypothetical protein VEI97_05035, partial [bacterium]|nr:hypothetical protein [bacterium]
MTWRTQFDALGRPVAQIDPLGYGRYTAYDACGRVTSQTDPVGNVTRFTYDAVGRRTETLTPRGYRYRATYYATGQLHTQTAPNGGVTTYLYDDVGRRIRITDPLTAATNFAYDQYGQLITRTDPETHVTSYEYNGFGELIEEILPPLATGGGGPLPTIYREYDKNGNVVSITPLDGTERTYAYDDFNRLVSRSVTYGTPPATYTSTYAYDNLGRLGSVLKPNGLRTEYLYDRNGRRTGLVRGKAAGDGQSILEEFTRMSWSYDAVGNLLTHTEGDGGLWAYEYDPLNRLVGMENPLSTPADPHRFTFEYDPASRLVAHVDYEGQRVTRSYNADSQLTGLYFPDGNRVEYDWTCCRVKTMRDQFGSHQMVYDLNQRLTAQTDPWGHLLTMAYDLDGHRTELGLPSGRSNSMTYTPKGSLETHTDAEGRITEFTYGPNGKLDTITFPNTRVVHHEYTPIGEIQRVWIALPTGPTPPPPMTPEAFEEATGTMLGTTSAPFQSGTTMPPNYLLDYVGQSVEGSAGSDGSGSSYGVPCGDPTEIYEEFEPRDPAAPCEKDTVGKFGCNFHVQLGENKEDCTETTFTSVNVSSAVVSINEVYSHNQTGAMTGRENLETGILTRFQFDQARHMVGYTAAALAAGLAVADGGLTGAVETALAVAATRNVTSDRNGNIREIRDPATGALRYHFHYDAAHRLTEALYLEADTDPVVWQVAYDGFGRKAVLRRNGEGVRFLYDGVQAVEVRREADDALVAEYTYAQGF